MAKKRRSQQPEPALAEVRDHWHGAAIRGMAGIRDGADIQTVTVGKQDGGAAVEVDGNGREILVHTEDAAVDHDEVGAPRRGTLLTPLNALFRKPPVGDKALVLVPQDVGEPVILHGDGAAEGNVVPEELDDTNTVLSPPTGDVIVRSRDGKVLARGDLEVTLKRGDSTITLSSSGISIDAAAGLNVNINAGAGANVVVNGGVRSVAADGDLAGMYPIKAAVPTFKTL